MVGLHKASFVVWLGATAVHVLAHAVEVPRVIRAQVPGLAIRCALVGASLIAGATVAVATLPAADHLQDRASAHFGLDAH